MLGMKENLIDMMGSVFGNRQHEAILRASKLNKHIREEEKYQAALNNLVKQDKKNAFAMEEAGNYLLNICVDEAYFLRFTGWLYNDADANTEREVMFGANGRSKGEG